MNDHEFADGTKWFECIVSWVADELIAHRIAVKYAARNHIETHYCFRRTPVLQSSNLSKYQSLTANDAYLHGLQVCSAHGSTSNTYTLLGVIQISWSCHYIDTSESILFWPNVDCTQDASHLGDISFT
jgi:hypothetical protein